MNKLSRKRLVDRLMEAYLSWREACIQVTDAYGSWTNETGLEATFAYAVYMAALDQEESAAEDYAGVVRQASEVFSGESVPAEVSSLL